MKFFKIIALVLALATLLAFVSCDTSGKTDGETTESTETTTEETTSAAIETTVTTEETTEKVEEETVEIELCEDYASFCSYKNDTVSFKPLSTSSSAAMSFTVPDGYVTELSLRLLAGNTYVETNFVISIYNFDGDFKDSIATEPIRSEKVGKIFQSYTLTFEEGELGKGDYLVVVTSEAEDGSDSLLLGGSWSKKALPEEYADYDFKFYDNGKATKSRALYGGFNIVHSVPKQPESPEDIVTEKDPEEVAKVIILSGQSNAVGTSVNYLLKQNIGDEEYSKYASGISNVKILFYNECLDANANVVFAQKSASFVDVKPGQGVNPTMFGPELGLAAYLSETYPDETFYIIKCATGGATLYGHYNPTTEGPDSNECLITLDQQIENGLKLLEDEGLTPKIVGMLWMQGESDANMASTAYNYYELETALIAHVREKYADYASVRGIAFVDAAVSNSGMWSNYLALNYSKILVSRDSHLNYYIDTNDYDLTTLYENNDFSHYDSTSMLLLGRLFGQTLSQAID